MIEERFKDNKKIHAFQYGLSGKDEEIEMSVMADGSSSVRLDSCVMEKVSLRDASESIARLGVTHIDLMKINIEGGEYHVLPNLISSGMVKNITDIQIQFHDFFDDAKEQREKIREELSKTHELTYDYYFVWENWRLKKN